MRNVILRYVFNSDSCFYLMKFLSRENGVLQFTCVLIGGLNQNLQELWVLILFCWFLAWIRKWIGNFFSFFFPGSNPLNSVSLFFSIFPLWSRLNSPLPVVNSRLNCRGNGSMMKIQCWISENHREFHWISLEFDSGKVRVYALLCVSCEFLGFLWILIVTE